MNEIKYGIQLFTVCNEFAKKPYETLYALKDMGYSYVESGEFALSASQWKSALAKSGLSLCCNHISIGYLESWFDMVMEYNDALGNRYIGYPHLRKGKSESANGYLEEAEVMNHMGKKLKERGYTLIYHNHAFEFKQFGGKYGLDILFENTDPDLVKFELDTYWITFGGEDPVKYIKKFAGRCDIIHLKDMDNAKDRNFYEVGEGILDFKAIISAAQESGAKYMLVEQDSSKRPQMESARISSENIKKIITSF